MNIWNFMLIYVEHVKSFIILGPDHPHFSYQLLEQIFLQCGPYFPLITVISLTHISP